jgi:hypothetical protein
LTLSRRATPARRRLSTSVVDEVRDAKILGVRAGGSPHRFVGIWAVVVRGRVFVRSWSGRPDGWYHALLGEGAGVIQVGAREVRVRARRARGERLMDAIDKAYREKYSTPGSRRYVRGFARPGRRAMTVELMPA